MNLLHRIAISLLSLICLGISALSQETIKAPLADGFDIPVGKPDGVGYYVFRGYSPNGHQGEDWNGKGGGNTDLGDPVYSCADGVVVQSRDVRLGWGNVVIIRHAYRANDGKVYYVDSLYGHLDKRTVAKDQIVRRGDQVGTIGTNRGMYYAHLHFEMRKNLNIGMNRSKFRRDYSNYWNPRNFIKSHRKLKAGTRKHPIPVNTFGEYTPPAGHKYGKQVKIPTKEEKKKQLQKAKEDAERKKRLAKALAKIIEENEKIMKVSDEEMDGFWSNLKKKLKRDKPGTPAKE